LILGCKNSVIPKGVNTIKSYAFHSCTLSEITISYGVKHIENVAFYGCENLTQIHFQGTKLQWLDLSKDINWNYGMPACSVHCADGTISRA
jgi:hypothetical protein